MNENELEKFIDHRLRRLPELTAPPSLAGNVLATLHRRENQPWFARPWLTWPLSLRLASGLLFLALLGAAAYFGRGLFQNLFEPLKNISNPLAQFEPVWQFLASLGNAGAAVLHQWQTQLWIAAGVLTFIYLSCIGMGTVFYRLALNQFKV